jgi:predicted DNA binding protein
MTVSAMMTLPATDFALGEVLSETGVRIELPQFVQITDSLVPYLWVNASDHDQETFIERVEGDHRVERLQVVDDLSEKTLYRIEWVHGIDDLLDLLIEHEVWVEQANTLSSEEQIDERAPTEADIGTGADVWRFQLRAPERKSLAAFYEACSEQGMELGIQQIVSSPGQSEGGQWNLTTKQREALMSAYDGGYFAVPRTISLTNLADDVGISHQAFSRRLMRGLDSVLTHTLVVEDALFDRE